MSNFSIKQLGIFPNFNIQEKEKQRIDKFLAFLDITGVDKIINKYVRGKNFFGGRPSYDPYKLFAGIVYAFVMKKTLYATWKAVLETI